MPLIDKDRTKNKKAPVCPYCESSIYSPSFMPEPGVEPFFQYMYCPVCKALLAIVPIPPTVPYDVEGTKEIVQTGSPKKAALR
jgi:hypothetical protein